MRTKAAFLIGGAVGYVLGTRAGRQQFEKIRESAQKVWENPTVQAKVADAGEMVKERAPELKEKVSEVVGKVRSKDDDTYGSSTAGSPSTGTSASTTGTTASGTTAPTNGSSTS